MTDPQPRNAQAQPRGPALHEVLDPEPAAAPEPAGNAETPPAPAAGPDPDPVGTPEGTPRGPGDPVSAGPAPIIDIETPLPPGSVKPLGPRRLARLQREMAEHQRQVEEAERRNAGRVDEDLLLKQQRFAQLALRAAAANEQDRRDAQAATRAAQRPSDTESSGAGAPGPSRDPQPGPAGERVEVLLPRDPGGASALSADPVRADPGQVAGSPLVALTGPETTQLHLFTGVVPVIAGARVTPAESTEPVAEAVRPETPEPAAEAAGPAAGAARPETPGPAPGTTGPEAVGESEAAVAGDGEPVGSAPAGAEATPAPPEHASPSEQVSPSDPEGREPAPAAPVRAVDAQGLELLDPQDYRQRPAALVPLVLLLAVVLAALLIVLAVFVL